MPGFTVLACPACGAKTSLAKETAVATCDYCGSQLILRPNEGVRLNYARNSSERPVTPMPAGVQVETLPDGIQIARRWFTPQTIFLAIFTVFWDGFLVLWYSVALFGLGELSFILFPLLHVAIGLFLTYTVLAGFLNTSLIRVSRSEFSVRHGPLPWPGAINLPASSLEQLYTRELVSRGKNGTSTRYHLSAVLRDGRKVDLLKGLETPDPAFFVEQQVESFLGIQDYPV